MATINEVLVLQKAVRARKNELVALRNQVSIRTTYYGQKESVVEPQYDVKKLDQQVSALDRWLFKSDTAIKKANAVTEVPGLDMDVDALLSPLE
jgi:hypothetical protein